MRPRLYLITPPAFEPEDFAATLTEALAGGDIACLQIRLKQPDGQPAPDAAIKAAAAHLLPIARAQNTAVLINDRPELVQETGADGVHLGQEDMDCTAARRLLGDAAMIGVSCHNSRHLAMLAGEAGADYVAFGAFYPTQTKQPKATATPDILQWWQETMTLPCVAIGGITPDNAAPLVNAGADFLAVSHGVWQHPQGAKPAIKAFNALFDAAEKKCYQGAQL